MAICDLARRFPQLRHGSGDVTRKPKAKATRNQQNPSQGEEPLNADCREQISDGDTRGDKKENVFSAAWSVHSLRRKPVAAWVRRQKGRILSGLESEIDSLLRCFLIQYILAMLIEEVKVYEPGVLHQFEMFPQGIRAFPLVNANRTIGLARNRKRDTGLPSLRLRSRI
jgi:hypothetical protein